MADRTVSVRILADAKQFEAAMAKAGASVKELGREIDKATKTSKGRSNLDEVSTAALGLGAALVAPAAAAVKLSMDFEKAMSAVKANVDNKSAPAMAKLKAAALEMGKTTQYSAIQAAQGEDELAKAGVGVTDIVNGGLKGALSLAAAGQLDVGSAAEIAASAMVQFGLTGQDIPHIADLLAAGADKAQGSVEDLGNALKYVGPVAASMGVSIESTVGVLTEFANQGIIGEQAGTGLRGVLSSLTSPSQQARQEMQKLGIQLYDGSGKFIGMAGTAQQLHDKLGKLTASQRDAALGMIFGNQQVTAARVLMQGGASAVNKYTKEVNDLGFAQQSANTKMDNLSGDLQKLKSALETNLIETGSGANSALRQLAQGATGAVTQFSHMPKPLQEAAVYTAGLGGAGLLAFAAYTKLKSKLAETIDSLNAMGPAGKKAGGALGTLSGLTGRLTVILAGLQVVSATMGHDVTVPLDKLSQSLVNYATTGKIAGSATTILGKNLKTFKSDVESFGTGGWEKVGTGIGSTVESFTGLGRVMDDSVYHATERIGQLDQALAGLVASGHADEAKKVFDQLLKATKSEGGNLNDLRNALPQYSAAVGDMTATQATSQKATNDQAAAFALVTGSMKEAIDAAGSLTSVWDSLNGKMASTDSALLQANQDVEALTQSLKDNGRSFSQSTTAGLKNRTAMEQLSKDAAAAAQAKYEESGSVDQATKTWNRYRQEAIDVLVQMGYTEKRAKALVDQFFQFPKNIKTNVSTPGAKQSSDAIKDLKRQEDYLKTQLRIAIQTHAPKDQVEALRREIAALHSREIWLTTHRVTITSYQTSQGQAQHVQGWTGGGRREADGGILSFYAAGGIRENHIAQIAPAGSWRVWAEPEAGPEAYIPLAPAKRSRSMAIWEETGRRLGVPAAQLAPVMVGGGGWSGPSAQAIGRATAAHLSGPLAVLAEAIQAGRVTSVQINGRELIHVMDDAQRQVNVRG